MRKSFRISLISLCCLIIAFILLVLFTVLFSSTPSSDSQKSACEGQNNAPVSTACLNEIWKGVGCTTIIPADYSGWWKTKSKSEIDADMALYGAATKPSSQYSKCRDPFA